ncbi:MAG: lipoate--protein ligase family protein [Chlamydiia bacterium]|nr:lipoate--protein ligase family protein [Chlamydiia bacterium]
MWKILDTGTRSAEENMEIDRDLLERMKPSDSPILHFYDWEGDAATYGYFLDPGKYLNLEGARAKGLSLARRPTGGGIIFHVSDLAFSVLVPADFPHFSLNTLDNYDFINNRVKKGVKTFFEKEPSLLPKDPTPLDESCRHFCMAKPTIYDVMLEGRKVAGAAQRRRKQGYLHQGSIAIALPKESFLDAILLPNNQVKEAMLSNTFSILGREWTPNDLQEVRETLKHRIQEELTQ